MRVLLVALVFFLQSLVPAQADDLDNALAAFHDRRFDEAIALLTPLAGAGEAHAQIVLAEINAHGLGVPSDGSAALDWGLRAAEQGNATGQMLVGGYYLQGLGATVDYPKAVHWYEQAAAQGHSAGLHNLGMLTLHGIGTKPDPLKAERLLVQAAEAGEADSAFLLGHIQLGKLLETGDIDPALGYFVDAALLGHRGAMAILANILDDLPEVDQHRIKAAFQYQTAIIAGCTDLAEASQAAMARLTASEAAGIQDQLDYWLPHLMPAIESRNEPPGPCLTSEGIDGAGKTPSLLLQVALGPM